MSQELDARVVINHQQIPGTGQTIFDNLQRAVSDFLNNKQWTDSQYAANEKINCSFNITLTKYDAANGNFEGTLLVQSSRPIYNANYTSTTFSIQDQSFNFNYKEFSPLLFRDDQVDDNLTAMLAYYAYLIIGIDLDTMSPKGGTTILLRAQDIVNAAQTLNFKGWKAFEDSRNRYAIISDYMDAGMEPLRKLQYKYYREGLDEMATNPDRARATIYDAMELLNQAHQNKPLSSLPQIFTDYKRDEIVNIFAAKGTPKECLHVYEILMAINPSQSAAWSKIK